MNPSRRFLIRSSTFSILFVWLGFSSFAVTQTLAQDSNSKASERIAPLFSKARQAEQRRDFAEAARLYDQVLRIDPGIAEVWTNMGLCLHELSKHRDAAKAFAKAAEIKPRLLVPHLFLGIEYLKLDQPQKAVSSLLSVLSIEPNHPQATYELANAYVRLDQFEQAVALYHRLLQRNPEIEEAWYRLGIAHLNWSRAAARKLIDSPYPSGYGKILLAELQAVAGRRQDAESNFQAAVAAQPDLVEARLAFGLFYLDDAPTSGQARAAQEQLTRAKGLDPGNQQVEMALIRLELVQENFVGALNRLQNALQVDPPFVRKHLTELAVSFASDRLRRIITEVRTLESEARDDRDASAKASAQALLYSANLELGAEKPAEAAQSKFEELAKILKTSPTSPGASYSLRLKQLQQQRTRPVSVAENLDLAVSALNLGEYARALESLLTVLRRVSDDSAYYWLFRTCRELARETFQKTIARNPDSYRAHLLLADLANDSHDTARACSEYEKALSTGNADPEVHLLFVQFLSTQLRVSEALEKARIAVAKFPAHSALNHELGKLLLKSGDAQRAIAHFHRSLEADSNFLEARAELADAHATLGEFGKAIEEMKQVLRADKDGSFHYRLGRWYQKIGQSSEANAVFAVASKLKENRREIERSKLIPLGPQNLSQ
ncbi:MAG: tetratricopeptide repeat protein [Acidobacteria bacterium]|nr:tetratricopeptide repeat protein [Acidobacteriota bacterium]